MQNNFFDKLDTMFLICEEMVNGHGEDSYYCVHKDESAVVSVYDGCGGLGSRTYSGFKNNTGAYMASRLISGSIHDWFHDMIKSKKMVDRELLTASLRKCIQKVYSVAGDYSENNLKISGSMVRDLPTTMAFALAQNHQQGVELQIIWAGDSRVYLLNKDGIAQLTKDDVKSDDAMSNLSDDGALTNVLSSDGKYSLHYRKLLLREPTIVFAATDGCFGYIPSPMEFEFEILSSIHNSNSIDEVRKNLESTFRDTAGDDFTFGFMSFFYETYNNMKTSLEKRFDAVNSSYILPLRKEPDNENLVMNLWEKYRKNYERYLEK